MKKLLTLCLVILMVSAIFIPYAIGEDKIGNIVVKKRLIQGNDVIEIYAINDKQNPFVTCYLTTINSGKILKLADPSNNCLSCRATGPITAIIDESTKMNVFTISKSIGWKTIRIARHYDKKRKVLIYTAYSTKILDGSYKHSMSVVPLK